MLLSSIVPPGQRHAHAGGDVAHDHHQQQAPNHSHDGHHHHHHDHHATDQHGLNADAAEPAAVAHVHFAWWLFDLTLPVPDESDTDDDESVYLVRLIGDCLPTTISSPATHSIDVSSPLPGNAVAPQSPTCRATTPPPTAVLLCDVARHERSGVQLF